MNLARTDFTGIAYLTTMVLAAGVAFLVYRKVRDAGGAVGDLAQKAGEAVTEVVTKVGDAVKAVPAAVSDAASSVFPSEAEQKVNAPGFWNNIGGIDRYSPLTFHGESVMQGALPDYLDASSGGALFVGESANQGGPFGAYVGAPPADESQQAIFYRRMSRTVH